MDTSISSTFSSSGPYSLKADLSDASITHGNLRTLRSRSQYSTHEDEASSISQIIYYEPNRSRTRLPMAALTIGLLVIGILASLSIPSPVVAGGVCIGFAGAAGLLYLAKGDLKVRVQRLILRMTFTALLIAGGTFSIMGIMQVAHLGYLILGVSGGLIVQSWLSTRYNSKNEHMLNYQFEKTHNAIDCL